MKYFMHCTSIEEVKSLYKKLAMENHPDRGGSTVIMQAINTEYAYACANVLKKGGSSAEETNHHIKLSEEYRKVVESIINLPGIVIEVVGHWIWVTGDTFPVKEKLKLAGLFYAPKKVAWYYRNEAFSVGRGKKSLDEIRNKYGSETISARGYRHIRR